MNYAVNGKLFYEFQFANYVEISFWRSKLSTFDCLYSYSKWWPSSLSKLTSY